MVKPRRGEIAEALRRRIVRGLQIEALSPGDRLPATRALSKELKVDPRVVAAAYRALAREGLVDLKPRVGPFVSRTFGVVKRRAGVAPDWIANVYAEGVSRGASVGDLPRVLEASLAARPIRTVVIATTADQTMGLCRELEDCFGLSCEGLASGGLASGVALPRVVVRAQLIITTEAHGQRVRTIAERRKVEFVCIALRPNLYAEEYALLRGQRAYVIVADARFARLVGDYLASVGGSNNVDVVVAGEADLSVIPADAPVYVTQAARSLIGATRLPDGLLPTARLVSTDCAREIIEAMLRIAAR